MERLLVYYQRRNVMRCPICNCRMKNKTVCPYCKITGTQVKGASNQLAKIALKNGKRKEVFNSTTIPFDVNYTRLLLIAIFTGFVGGHDYYVGKYAKGIFCSASVVWASLMIIIGEVFGAAKYFVFGLFYEISVLCASITVLFWICDIFGIAVHNFSMPVVLLDELQADANIKMKEEQKKKANND